MPYIASNNGLTVMWHDPSENYQPQAGESDMGAEYPTLAQIQAAFPNYVAPTPAAPVDPIAALANQIKSDQNGLAAIKQVLGL